MSKKITHRLILKDSENRAVFVDIKDGKGLHNLSEIGKACFQLAKNYSNLLEDENKHKEQSEQNDIAIAEKQEKIVKEAKNTAAKLKKKDEPTKPKRRKRLPRIKKEERKLTSYH